MKKIKMKKQDRKNKSMIWGLFYRSDLQGCGFYRSTFPMMVINLYHNHPKFQIDIMEANRIFRDPNFYSYTNIIQVQRWDNFHHVNAVNYFLKMKAYNPKLKIIYDIDDDIPNTPSYNYGKTGYYYPDFNTRLKIILEIIKYVDLVLVSTPRLKKIYSNLNPNIEVVDNYLPKFLWSDVKFKENPERKVMKILWSGSGTHFLENNNGDLKNVVNLIKKSKGKYHWTFLGAIPEVLKGYSNVNFIPWKTMLELPMVYKNLDVDVGIAPLENNNFNKSKSSIKAKEYIATGIPGIYFDIEPYKKCTLKYKSIEELEKFLELCYNDKNYRREIWEKDYKKFRKDLWLEENIYKRIDIYTKL